MSKKGYKKRQQKNTVDSLDYKFMESKSIVKLNELILLLLNSLEIKFPFLFTTKIRFILSLLLIIFGSFFLLGSLLLLCLSIYYSLNYYILMGILDIIISLFSIYSGYNLIKKLKNKK